MIKVDRGERNEPRDGQRGHRVSILEWKRPEGDYTTLKRDGKASKSSGHAAYHDAGYEASFRRGKIEQSNLEANISFLENTHILDPEQRILEVGCGAGTLASYFAKRGYNIVAIDISTVALKKAIELHGRLTICQMDAERLAFAANSFDIVLSFDTLEHIAHVDNHVREVKRVLKRGGYYIFGTPNKFTSILFSLVRDKSRRYRTYHPSLQSYFSVSNLMKKHDFQLRFIKHPIMNRFAVEKIEKMLGNPIAGIIAKVRWEKVPLALYPSFYVIGKVSTEV